MIPFDFEYYKPNTLKEAFDYYRKLASAHKNPRYYSGATELISMNRVNSIVFDSVIDSEGNSGMQAVSAGKRRIRDRQRHHADAHC